MLHNTVQFRRPVSRRQVRAVKRHASNPFDREYDSTEASTVLASATVTTVCGNGRDVPVDGVPGIGSLSNPRAICPFTPDRAYSSEDAFHVLVADSTGLRIASRSMLRTLKSLVHKGTASSVSIGGVIQTPLGIVFSDDVHHKIKLLRPVPESEAHSHGFEDPYETILEDPFYREQTKVKRTTNQTHVLLTLAGSVAGHADGVITKALFKRPTTLASACNGRIILVADTGNNCIRCIDIQNRFVTTLVGSPGATRSPREKQTRNPLDPYIRDRVPIDSATLLRPTGLCVSQTRPGVVFVADTGNHTVKLIDTVNQVAQNIAGIEQRAGTAAGYESMLHCPRAVCELPDSTLLVLDRTGLSRVCPERCLLWPVANLCVHVGWRDGPLNQALFTAPTALLSYDDRIFVADGGTNSLRMIVFGAPEPLPTDSKMLVETKKASHNPSLVYDAVPAPAHASEPRENVMYNDGSIPTERDKELDDIVLGEGVYVRERPRITGVRIGSSSDVKRVPVPRPDEESYGAGQVSDWKFVSRDDSSEEYEIHSKLPVQSEQQQRSTTREAVARRIGTLLQAPDNRVSLRPTKSVERKPSSSEPDDNEIISLARSELRGSTRDTPDTDGLTIEEMAPTMQRSSSRVRFSGTNDLDTNPDMITSPRAKTSTILASSRPPNDPLTAAINLCRSTCIDRSPRRRAKSADADVKIVDIQGPAERLTPVTNIAKRHAPEKMHPREWRDSEEQEERVRRDSPAHSSQLASAPRSIPEKSTSRDDTSAEQAQEEHQHTSRGVTQLHTRRQSNRIARIPSPTRGEPRTIAELVRSRCQSQHQGLLTMLLRVRQQDVGHITQLLGGRPVDPLKYYGTLLSYCARASTVLLIARIQDGGNMGVAGYSEDGETQLLSLTQTIQLQGMETRGGRTRDKRKDSPLSLSASLIVSILGHDDDVIVKSLSICGEVTEVDTVVPDLDISLTQYGALIENTLWRTTIPLAHVVEVADIIEGDEGLSPTYEPALSCPVRIVAVRNGRREALSAEIRLTTGTVLPRQLGDIRKEPLQKFLFTQYIQTV
ncbi:NHL repeat-containing protein [Giardia muris]|uniref:NHL repeat-containing protein n=1 Tax=Giardia muris TaxID=5742 RepID=A0A4Z1T4J5_GIAMU|nr:NHL repeat-containing protein [Giardia muris]|eukprot:TNJ27987.1 NHL repeat-containing protein [Giardia muris]